MVFIWIIIKAIKKIKPEYYEIIKDPVDINRIERRIKDNKYGSIEVEERRRGSSLSEDVVLMFDNAQVSLLLVVLNC